MKINEFDHHDHGWKWRECEVRWIEAKIAEAAAAEREACAKLVANDALALSFQTLGQYRTALIKAMRSNAALTGDGQKS